MRRARFRNTGFRSLRQGGRGRLPKCLTLYIKPLSWGHVAEWLRNGLQNRVHQFNSGRGLHVFQILMPRHKIRSLMVWKCPKIVEASVGMETNMYACAVRK